MPPKKKAASKKEKVPDEPSMVSLNLTYSKAQLMQLDPPKVAALYMRDTLDKARKVYNGLTENRSKLREALLVNEVPPGYVGFFRFRVPKTDRYNSYGENKDVFSTANLNMWRPLPVEMFTKVVRPKHKEMVEDPLFTLAFLASAQFRGSTGHPKAPKTVADAHKKGLPAGRKFPQYGFMLDMLSSMVESDRRHDLAFFRHFLGEVQKSSSSAKPSVWLDIEEVEAGPFVSKASMAYSPDALSEPLADVEDWRPAEDFEVEGNFGTHAVGRYVRMDEDEFVLYLFSSTRYASMREEDDEREENYRLEAMQLYLKEMAKGRASEKKREERIRRAIDADPKSNAWTRLYPATDYRFFVVHFALPDTDGVVMDTGLLRDARYIFATSMVNYRHPLELSSSAGLTFPTDKTLPEKWTRVHMNRIPVKDFYHTMLADCTKLDPLEEDKAVELKKVLANTTLRPYQLHGVNWMLTRERVSLNMALWQRRPIGTGDKHVYLPPFPTPTSSRGLLTPPVEAYGGILADEMGLGKTLQMVGLIGITRTEAAAHAEAAPINVKGTLVITPVSLFGQWQSELMRRAPSLKVLVYHGPKRHKGLRLKPSLPGDPPGAFFADYDVVLSTFSMLSTKFDADGPMHRVNWFRVAVDESHLIRPGANKRTASILALKGSRKWGITGTPIALATGDLNAQLRFLGVSMNGVNATAPVFPHLPTRYYEPPPATFQRNFNTVAHPFHYQEDGQRDTAGEWVVRVLRATVLHRVGTQLDSNGRKLVELPPQHVQTHHAELDEDERTVYQFVHGKCKQEVQEVAKLGEEHARRQYFRVVSQVLLPLRTLATDFATVSDAFWLRMGFPVPVPEGQEGGDDEGSGTGGAAKLMKRADGSPKAVDAAAGAPTGSASTSGPAGAKRKEPAAAALTPEERLEWLIKNPECCICLDAVDEAAFTPCGHGYCLGCVTSLAQADGQTRCPLCRTIFKIADIVVHEEREDPLAAPEIAAMAAIPSVGLDEKPSEEVVAAWERLRKRGSTEHGSKLRFLIDLLRGILEKDPSAQIVVFSSFSQLVRSAHAHLAAEGLSVVRITGDTVAKKRSEALIDFQAGKAKVFLLSLRTGAVGLTLTAANHLVLLEPALSKAVELQAVNRIHRVGQARETTTHHVVSTDTLEEAIHKRSRELGTKDPEGKAGASAANPYANVKSKWNETEEEAAEREAKKAAAKAAAAKARLEGAENGANGANSSSAGAGKKDDGEMADDEAREEDMITRASESKRTINVAEVIKIFGLKM